MPKSRVAAQRGGVEWGAPMVIALPSADEVQATTRALLEQGVAASALLRLAPEEMMAQVDECLRDPATHGASAAALNLLKAQRLLAESGCSFLIVTAEPEPDAATTIDAPPRMKSRIGAALWPARSARTERSTARERRTDAA